MRNILFSFILIILTGCVTLDVPFEMRQILNRLSPNLKQHQVYAGDPVFIRIFKEEHILELWMKSEDSYQYSLVKTYPICKWSGALGPKLKEGDHQSPEGFYSTDSKNLNPNSKYHVSFNIQFPNEYDRSLERTGTFIMVHGDCVSEGCYAMTDDQIEEIYILTDSALRAGQVEIPVHVFPFKMTSERMTMEIGSPHFNFWLNLREGYKYFEKYAIPPKWTVENKQYVFY